MKQVTDRTLVKELKNFLKSQSVKQERQYFGQLISDLKPLEDSEKPRVGGSLLGTSISSLYFKYE